MLAAAIKTLEHRIPMPRLMPSAFNMPLLSRTSPAMAPGLAAWACVWHALTCYLP